MKLFLHFPGKDSAYLENHVIELPMLPRVGDFVAAQELGGRVFRVMGVLHSKPADTDAEIVAEETSFGEFLGRAQPARPE